MVKQSNLFSRALQKNTSPSRNWKAILGWRRDSSVLLGGFLLTILLIAYIWWPLAEEYLAFIPWDGHWWWYVDWLLVAIFLFMSLTIIPHADLRTDAQIVFVGTIGGLVIESWGTQTNLWFYYTAERPPLWIVPAWPIASLSIDRITRALDYILPDRLEALTTKLYWAVMIGFYLLMLTFTWPTIGQSLTQLSLLLCLLLILSENNKRSALLAFIAGTGLGYFLERWGTTRECWMYYTFQKPPLFAVLAHGMAAMAFYRANGLLSLVLIRSRFKRSNIIDRVETDSRR